MKILYTKITNCAMCPNYFIHESTEPEDAYKYGACELLHRLKPLRIGLLEETKLFDFRNGIHNDCKL